MRQRKNLGAGSHVKLIPENEEDKSKCHLHFRPLCPHGHFHQNILISEYVRVYGISRSSNKGTVQLFKWRRIWTLLSSSPWFSLWNWSYASIKKKKSTPAGSRTNCCGSFRSSLLTLCHNSKKEDLYCRKVTGQCVLGVKHWEERVLLSLTWGGFPSELCCDRRVRSLESLLSTFPSIPFPLAWWTEQELLIHRQGQKVQRSVALPPSRLTHSKIGI